MFTWSTTLQLRPKDSVTQMLMRDLFAVVNLLVKYWFYDGVRTVPSLQSINQSINQSIRRRRRIGKAPLNLYRFSDICTYFGAYDSALFADVLALEIVTSVHEPLRFSVQNRDLNLSAVGMNFATMLRATRKGE